jgi:hypothetical protein
MFTINNQINLDIKLDSAGVNVYVGHNDIPTKGYTLTELTHDFLDDFCDTDGKIYPDVASELDDLLEQMKVCVKLLVNAKN